MSYTTLKDVCHVARKEYKCDAYNQIFNRIGMNDLTIGERCEVLRFELKGCRINKGEKYSYHVGISNGDFGVFRANLKMLEIYYNHQIYEE
jgi:hypothetical protein